MGKLTPTDRAAIPDSTALSLTGVPCCAGAGSRGINTRLGYENMPACFRSLAFDIFHLEGRAQDTGGPPGPAGFHP